MQHFVYIWKDTTRNMFYVGMHSGDMDYVSSSRWHSGEHSYRPQDFRRRIIKYFDSRSEARLYEESLLRIIFAKPNYERRYYNRKHGAKRGCIPWNKGKPTVHSPEHRANISKSKMGVSVPNPSAKLVAAQNGKRGAAKLSSTAKGRKRKYLSDGSWTWSYPEK